MLAKTAPFLFFAAFTRTALLQNETENRRTAEDVHICLAVSRVTREAAESLLTAGVLLIRAC
jgi:hypothetical protein